DPLTATGPAIAEILARPAQYQGQTLPVIGDILSPRDIVATFSRVTGIDAGYPLRLLKAYLITWPVAFASLLLVRPLVVKWVAASITD
ncbi:DUF2798 domain-containing protein, partial [Cardiobacterium hominis]